MTISRTITVCAGLTVLVGWTAARTAVAAESASITVSGAGEVRARPTMMQMGASVSGEAELAGDAVVKFNDARRRALEAIEGLGIKNLTIAGQGVAINNASDSNQLMAAMRGQANPNLKPKVQVTEQFHLRLSGIDKVSVKELVEAMVRIVDASKDAGLRIGPSGPMNVLQMQMQQGMPTSLVTFKLDDTAEVRKAAYARAVDDARRKAEQLAALAGAPLGSIRSVRETPVAAEPESPNLMMMRMMIGMMAGGSEDGASSDVLADIPVRVELTVVFELDRP